MRIGKMTLTAHMNLASTANEATSYALNSVVSRQRMNQLRFSGEKVLFRGRAIAILRGIDTTTLTANNFEST